MNMQEYIDNMSKKWRQERAETQMTLGELMRQLSAMDPDSEITGIHEQHSYRGYYSDLAFEAAGNPMLVTDLIDMLTNECLGKTFTGYKGGEFTMESDTPLWIAEYGCCGPRIMSINQLTKNSFELVTEEEEDYNRGKIKW